MDENEQIWEIYAHYGLAMYFAQCVEIGITTLVTFVYSGTPQELTNADVEKIWNALSKKTFGMLIHELKHKTKVPINLESRLIKARDNRNWLAHHYFYERAPHFYEADSRRSMMDELDRLREEFSLLNDDLDKIFENWIKQNIKITKSELLRQGLEITAKQENLDLNIDSILASWSEAK